MVDPSPRVEPAGRGRLAVAFTTSAAIVLSAPFAQQVFTEIELRWPAYLRTIGVAASVAPATISCGIALWRIREQRLRRYMLMALAIGLAVASILISGLNFAESFHFIEYGAVAWLFYRVWHRTTHDASLFVLPLLAGTLVASVDEWFQWFIPIRSGEARDVTFDCLAAGCGVLFAAAVELPRWTSTEVERQSLARLGRWSAAALAAFSLFFVVVHVGHAVTDPDVGSFLSRYTAAELVSVARDRVDRWRSQPPVRQERLSREDQYLTEGLWHVRRRNEAWDAGDINSAWHQNLILEKFYAPVLDSPTYAGASGQRWSPQQRDDARARVAETPGRYESTEYAYPLYVLPRVFDSP